MYVLGFDHFVEEINKLQNGEVDTLYRFKISKGHKKEVKVQDYTMTEQVFKSCVFLSVADDKYEQVRKEVINVASHIPNVTHVFLFPKSWDVEVLQLNSTIID